MYALRRRLKALVGVVRGLGSSCEAAVIATARSLLARMTTTECEVFTSSEDGERPPWLTDEAFKECWRTGRLPEVVAVPPPAAEEHDIHDAALKVKVRDEYVAQRRRVLSTVVRAEHPDMERTAQRAEVVTRARKEFKALDPTSFSDTYKKDGGIYEIVKAFSAHFTLWRNQEDVFKRHWQEPLEGILHAAADFADRCAQFYLLSRAAINCGVFTLYTTDRTQTNTNRDR